MEIKKRSTFKDPEKDTQWFKQWVAALEQHNNRHYHFSANLATLNPEKKKDPKEHHRVVS